MARTIQTIYDSLIAEKQSQTALNGLQPAIDDAQTLLNDLTSTSKVAKWRLDLWIVAVAINALENLFDLFRAEIEARALEIPAGTLKWYTDQTFLFQLGDVQVYNTAQQKFVYDPINEANRIVKRAVAGQIGDQVRIKTAKLDGSGNPIALTVAELSALNDFWNGPTGNKFAGTNLAITSSDPDELRVDLFVQYDPEVLASDGSLLVDPATFPVIDAINGFISDLPFNSILNLTALTDAIQNADGVVDPVMNDATSRFGALPFTSINKNLIPDAGYLILDEPGSTIVYTTQTVV